ncbi:MAG: GAF domain-containing protein [Pyrinomonadaceae bacterium]
MKVGIKQIEALVSGTLDRRTPLPEVLARMARMGDAYGCILWQAAPDIASPDDPSARYLFKLAEWFPDNVRCTLRNLPLNGSLSGLAVLTGKAQKEDDIWKQGSDVFTDHSFLSDARIRTMCSVPLKFRDDGQDGVLNFYRNEPRPFTDEDMEQVADLTLIIPALYQIASERDSLELLRKINDALHAAETATSEKSFPPAKRVNGVLRNICGLVCDGFQCVETSVLLEDPIEEPGVFKVIATTWPDVFERMSYTGRVSEGLTSWTIHHRKSLKVFDLSRFDSEKNAIRQEYPRLVWKHQQNMIEVARAFLKLKVGETLPPVSYMAVPIMKGKRVLGAMRCSIPRKGRFHFTDRELEVLQLVAAQVSRYWSNWLARRAATDENKSWRDMVEGVRLLNTFVYKELTGLKPDGKRIYDQALRVTKAVLGRTDVIMDVRAFDEEKQALYFAFDEPPDEAWNEGSPEDVAQRKSRTFDVTAHPPTSAGAWVYQTGRVRHMEDVKKDEFYKETFPGVTRMIIAPIKVHDRTFGVLDIRGRGDRKFPPHAPAFSELLGQQLGMYSHLAETVGMLRRTEGELNQHVEELERIRDVNIQIFQDLAHQFKTPIIQAHSSIQLLLDDQLGDEPLRQRLRAVRGLCGKAKRVSYNTELFSALARGMPLQVRDETALTHEDLMKMLIEAAIDNKLINSRRKINFFVDKEDFEKSGARYPRMRTLDTDRNLIEQAITDILDNAGKYSFSGKTVLISGGRTNSGGFQITVSNYGITLRAADVPRCHQYGWQGEEAKAVSVAGSGIGLWIVHNIMKAHDGLLLIEPTTPDDLTKVKLVFPSARVK